MSERLVIGDANSIAKVKQYELDHGYDRNTDEEITIFEVTVCARLISTDMKKYNIQANTEEMAKKKALKLAKDEDWEADDFDVNEVYIDEIEEQQS